MKQSKQLRPSLLKAQKNNLRVRTARIVKLNQKQIGKIMPKQVQRMSKQSLKKLIHQQYLFLRRVEFRRFLWSSMPLKPEISPYILRIKKRVVFDLQQVINIFVQLQNKIIDEEKENFNNKQEKLFDFIENFEFHINQIIQELPEVSKDINIQQENLIRLVINKQLRNFKMTMRDGLKRSNRDTQRRKNVREDAGNTLSQFSKSKKISGINLANTQAKYTASNIINRQTIAKLRQLKKKTQVYQSEFRELIKKKNVFKEPRQINYVYRNKKMAFYKLQEDQMDLRMQQTHEKTNVEIQKSNLKKFSAQQIQFIRGWIQEIDLSSELFEQRARNILQFYDYYKDKQSFHKQYEKAACETDLDIVSGQSEQNQ